MSRKLVHMEPCREVMGHRFWRMESESGKGFDIYVARAHDTKTGLFWFQSLRSKKLISRNHFQVCWGGFYPVLFVNPNPVKEKETPNADARIRLHAV